MQHCSIDFVIMCDFGSCTHNDSQQCISWYRDLRRTRYMNVPVDRLRWLLANGLAHNYYLLATKLALHSAYERTNGEMTANENGTKKRFAVMWMVHVRFFSSPLYRRTQATDAHNTVFAIKINIFFSFFFGFYWNRTNDLFSLFKWFNLFLFFLCLRRSTTARQTEVIGTHASPCFFSSPMYAEC